MNDAVHAPCHFTHHGIFVFPADDPIYADHFPSAPVVPGSLIMHAFLQEAARLGCVVSGIRNFRFRSFAVPGRYAFAMTGKDHSIRCELTHYATDRPELHEGEGGGSRKASRRVLLAIGEIVIVPVCFGGAEQASPAKGCHAVP